MDFRLDLLPCRAAIALLLCYASVSIGGDREIFEAACSLRDGLTAAEILLADR